MKKVWIFLLLLSMLVLSACTAGEIPTATEAGIPTEATAEPTAEPSTEAATESAPEAASSQVPYLVKILRADFPIYKSFGYESEHAAYVDTPGTFTIVEEAYDKEDNLWGKLKSGAGWVDLTRLEKETARGPLIEIIPVTEQHINSGDFHSCVLSTDPFTQQILLKANATLTNVEVFPLVLTERLEEQEPAYTLPQWNTGELLLVEAAFPGDMSTYGIRVTDGDGVTYRYNIWENLSGEGAQFGLSTYAP